MLAAVTVMENWLAYFRCYTCDLMALGTNTLGAVREAGFQTVLRDAPGDALAPSAGLYEATLPTKRALLMILCKRSVVVRPGDYTHCQSGGVNDRASTSTCVLLPPC